mgnify:CR=1 FL=1
MLWFYCGDLLAAPFDWWTLSTESAQFKKFAYGKEADSWLLTAQLQAEILHAMSDSYILKGEECASVEELDRLSDRAFREYTYAVAGNRANPLTGRLPYHPGEAGSQNPASPPALPGWPGISPSHMRMTCEAAQVPFSQTYSLLYMPSKTIVKKYDWFAGCFRALSFNFLPHQGSLK